MTRVRRSTRTRDAYGERNATNTLVAHDANAAYSLSGIHAKARPIPDPGRDGSQGARRSAGGLGRPSGEAV
jgi:hypothetical protein